MKKNSIKTDRPGTGNSISSELARKDQEIKKLSEIVSMLKAHRKEDQEIISLLEKIGKVKDKQIAELKEINKFLREKIDLLGKINSCGKENELKGS